MAKKKRNTTYIVEIPQGSLVLICGAANSGKTHFTKKHFPKNDNLVTFHTDDAFYNQMQKATIFDTYDSLTYKTEELLVRTVIEASNHGKTMVIDAAAYDAEKRYTMINEFRQFFKNIVLIVLDPEESELLKRGNKLPTQIGLKFNMIPPGPQAMLLQSRKIRAELNLGLMEKHVDQMYHITSAHLTKTKVILT